jgi:hypothetical protein
VNFDLPADTFRLTPQDWLVRLSGELERWGELFLRLARDNKAPAAEQVVGGLVDWMGNGLMDGWLHLPLPVFEALSDLAEELLQAFQAYLAWLGTEGAKAGEGRSRHEESIRAILARTRGLAHPASRSPTPHP